MFPKVATWIEYKGEKGRTKTKLSVLNSSRNEPRVKVFPKVTQTTVHIVHADEKTGSIPGEFPNALLPPPPPKGFDAVLLVLLLAPKPVLVPKARTDEKSQSRRAKKKIRGTSRHT